MHPNEFEVYINTTPVFFPKLSLLTEPEEYRVYTKHSGGIYSALLVRLASWSLEIIEELHGQGLIPVLFKIY